MTRSADDVVILHSRLVLPVARCGPVYGPQYALLVLNALGHSQPVEVRKERSDVVVTLRANGQTM